METEVQNLQRNKLNTTHVSGDGSVSLIIDRILLLKVWVERRGSWLRHCATNRKVVGLIPYGVSGIFQ
jgi:hypothetical protein